MGEKVSKLDQVKALRIARATGQSSRGSPEKESVLQGSPPPRPTRRQATVVGKDRVTPGPREAKPSRKRAPAGTFDRKAYQREYMRKARANVAAMRKQAEQRAKAKQ